MVDDLMQGAKATLATDAPSFVHEPWRTAHDGQAGRAKPMGLCCTGQNVTIPALADATGRCRLPPAIARILPGCLPCGGGVRRSPLQASPG